jgi:methylsterol monooxygenase
MGSDPTRVVIYVTVTDIDALPPQTRHIQIGEQFCKYTDREFHVTLNPALYYHIRIPADFDSPEPVRRWSILDLNVTQALDKEDVCKLPHQVFLATKRGDQLAR